MGFIADHPEFSPPVPVDARPECVRENRVGTFDVLYSDATPDVLADLDALLVVKDRQKDSAWSRVIYTAYSPKFEPRSSTEDPLHYCLHIKTELDPVTGSPVRSYQFEHQWYTADVA